MSFFGGNTSLSATSTPAKPGGLFASFGTTPAAAVAPAPAFGVTAAPAFGATAAPAFGSTAAPAFGNTAAPAFGSITAPAFGASTAGTGAPTSFGSNPAFGTTGFGATTATSSAPTLGGFSGFGTGTNVTTAAAPTLGGFGGFGTGVAPTSTAPSLFGNATQTTSTNFGGFGTGVPTSTATGFAGFGTTATTTTAPTFGGFGATSTGFSGFGTNTAFGTNFNKPANTTVTPGFSGFYGNTNFMLGQPQQQVPQLTPDEAFAQSIFNVSIYGDERDTIIAKWNYLQALCGTGKAFYSQTAAPVQITPENYLCRFKEIGFSRMPGNDNKMGLVALNINRPLSDAKGQQHQLTVTLNAVLGNKPNLVINIESSKELEEKKCQYVIYVEEKSQTVTLTATKRITATDLAAYLNQPQVKQQLANFAVTEILALVLPDEDQLKEYLANPPKGIDPRMWSQAKLDNPDATKFLPVPMHGFNDLKWRIKCQENETEMHALYLEKVEKDLNELRQRHITASAKIMEQRRKLAELSHNALRIIVKQECTRKVGLALTPEEEALGTKLENMQALVSAPTQFKGRLSELLSQMRMQRSQFASTGGNDYTIEKEYENEMKTFLAMQQKAIAVITDTVRKDLKSLQIISNGLPDLLRS